MPLFADDFLEEYNVTFSSTENEWISLYKTNLGQLVNWAVFLHITAIRFINKSSNYYFCFQNTYLSLLKLMTGILLLDTYSVTPISIFNISPSLPSQLPTVAMRFVIAFIKPILCLCHGTQSAIVFFYTISVCPSIRPSRCGNVFKPMHLYCQTFWPTC